MSVKTGVFGGTFNPIHIGHLALANYLCEYGGLDEIWFLVSPQNPFKQNIELLDDNIRLEMVQQTIIRMPEIPKTMAMSEKISGIWEKMSWMV